MVQYQTPISSVVILFVPFVPLKTKITTTITMNNSNDKGEGAGMEMFAIILFDIVLACKTSFFVSVTLEDMKIIIPMMCCTLGITTFLTLSWIIMTCFATIVWPFTDTGNGYFASKEGAIVASTTAFAAKQALFDTQD